MSDEENHCILPTFELNQNKQSHDPQGNGISTPPLGPRTRRALSHPARDHIILFYFYDRESHPNPQQLISLLQGQQQQQQQKQLQLLTSLPQELLDSIFKYLNVKDLVSVQRVCRSMSKACRWNSSLEFVWRQELERLKKKSPVSVERIRDHLKTDQGWNDEDFDDVQKLTVEVHKRLHEVRANVAKGNCLTVVADLEYKFNVPDTAVKRVGTWGNLKKYLNASSKIPDGYPRNRYCGIDFCYDQFTGNVCVLIREGRKKFETSEFEVCGRFEVYDPWFQLLVSIDTGHNVASFAICGNRLACYRRYVRPAPWCNERPNPWYKNEICLWQFRPGVQPLYAVECIMGMPITTEDYTIQLNEKVLLMIPHWHPVALKSIKPIKVFDIPRLNLKFQLSASNGLALETYLDRDFFVALDHQRKSLNIWCLNDGSRRTIHFFPDATIAPSLMPPKCYMYFPFISSPIFGSAGLYALIDLCQPDGSESELAEKPLQGLPWTSWGALRINETLNRKQSKNDWIIDVQQRAQKELSIHDFLSEKKLGRLDVNLSATDEILRVFMDGFKVVVIIQTSSSDRLKRFRLCSFDYFKLETESGIGSDTGEELGAVGGSGNTKYALRVANPLAADSPPGVWPPEDHSLYATYNFYATYK